MVPDGSNYYKRWQLGSQPSTLYVEGCSAGSAELWLLYSNSTNPDQPSYPGGDKNHDPVKFTAVKIKVVKQGTMDEGPIYPGCPGTSVTLESKTDPEGSPIPHGEPHWTLEKPDGSSATLSNSVGATTTLSNTNKFGDYIVTAKCANGCGDSITVTYNLVNETQFSAYTPTWGTYPSSCPPGPCDGEDSYEEDDCGNELEVSCCQSDGTGGAFGCAYRMFYNDSLKSSCVFSIEPDNYFARKTATIEGTTKSYITKIYHENISKSKYLGGCWGYYCTKFYTYDCIENTESEIWRRDPDGSPYDEQDGEPCPGH